MSGIVRTNSGRVSGSIGSAGSGITTSSSDPEVDTNPPGGIGTVFTNTTSGETYVCTDDTTDENVWINVGDGTGNVALYHFANASLYCFAPAGNTSGSSNVATIDKNAFASNANSTDQGDVTAARRGNSCASSTTHGYCAGGYTGAPFVNIIDRFAMGSTANSTDVGDLTSTGQTGAGITSSTHGHVACGTYTSATRDVKRWSFASGTEAGTSLGDLISVARDYPVGGSSELYGYVMGSYSGSPVSQIEKFAFADNATTADVGDLVSTSNSMSHCEDGYVWTSGQFNTPADDKIEKMATASDNNSTDSGSSLSVTVSGNNAGNASKTYGYAMGGSVGGNHGDVVDRWPYASSSTASDVGDLTVVREGIASVGCQL